MKLVNERVTSTILCYIRNQSEAFFRFAEHIYETLFTFSLYSVYSGISQRSLRGLRAIIAGSR